MKALEIKGFTASRYANMKSCDQKYYRFSADWSVAQDKAVCNAALKTFDLRMKAMRSGEWGSGDTADILAALASLRKTFKLTTDGMQNSFALYQLERYALRCWYRGTKEQRDAALKAHPELGSEKPKAEAKPAAKKTAPKKNAAKKVEVKATVTTKKPAPKSEAVVNEVEVDEPLGAQLINYLCSFLQDELTGDQKTSFVSGLAAALKNS